MFQTGNLLQKSNDPKYFQYNSKGSHAKKLENIMSSNIQMRFVNISYYNTAIPSPDYIHVKFCDFSQWTKWTPEVLFFSKSEVIIKNYPLLIKFFPETIE